MLLDLTELIKYMKDKHPVEKIDLPKVKYKDLNDVIKGDTVMVDSSVGFCSGGEDKITKISYKYNEDTGEKYKVIHLGSHLYNTKGEPITPPWAYYIYSIAPM